nr:MAG: hypothetical protein EDM05_27145 [Leptolyngbya sp. IPPAS B-1204]
MIAMALTEMTFDDLMRLEQFRNERLRSFFAESLLHCVFRRDGHKVLLIYCPEAWIVDKLLTDLEELCDYAWLILGSEAIALYFAQEEICRIGHNRVHYEVHSKIHNRVHKASIGIRHNILRRSWPLQKDCNRSSFRLKSL